MATQKHKANCVDCGKLIWQYSTRCKPCQGRMATKRVPTECKGCGKAITRKGGGKDARKYCSRECAFADPNRPRGKGFIRERTSTPYRKVWFRKCSVCDAAFTARRLKQITCSRACLLARSLAIANEKYQPRPPTRKQCITCGSWFEKKGARLHCSTRCGQRIQKAIDKVKRRTRERLTAVEKVNPLRVFDRDGWSCQICGKDTPKASRGTYHSNAPELDHRIPLSLGGGHTYANTQCTCRSCNGVKGNKTEKGQLPLFSQQVGGGALEGRKRLFAVYPHATHSQVFFPRLVFFGPGFRTNQGVKVDFKPTDDQRFSVSVVAGSGEMSHEEIALALGISVSDLRTHFAAELTLCAYRRRQEVIEAQYKAALKGSVSAQKAYLAKTPKAAAPPLQPKKPEPAPGKKAQAQVDAVTAQNGTEWESLLKSPGPAH